MILPMSSPVRKWPVMFSSSVATLSSCFASAAIPDSPGSAPKEFPELRPTIVPMTGFGGYRWLGGISQVSARWRVPTISATSLSGSAGTWIGAQNAYREYPFIQVRTNEVSQSGRQIYHAFWSDTHVGFRAQSIGTVEPGDLISANMVRSRRGWTLSIDDLTQGTLLSRTVGYGGGSAFTQAEWIQEDPTASNVTTSDLPYPDLSKVHFAHLLVNNTIPSLSLKDGQTLMAPAACTWFRRRCATIVSV
jgi:hypothetical protein